MQRSCTAAACGDQDKPLQACLRLRDADALIAAAGLGATRSAVNEASCAVLANLIRLVQTGGGAWIFYSRDNNHYAATTRYTPKFYRRSIMIEAADRLVDAGLAHHQKTRPSPSARLRASHMFRRSAPCRTLVGAHGASCDRGLWGQTASEAHAMAGLLDLRRRAVEA